MLEKVISYFKKVQDELRATNPNGGFAVIKDEELLGIWLNRTDALKAGVQKWGAVSFLVKEINDDLNQVINFSRNLKFSNAPTNITR